MEDSNKVVNLEGTDYISNIRGRGVIVIAY